MRFFGHVRIRPVKSNLNKQKAPFLVSSTLLKPDNDGASLVRFGAIPIYFILNFFLAYNFFVYGTYTADTIKGGYGLKSWLPSVIKRIIQFDTANLPVLL